MTNLQEKEKGEILKTSLFRNQNYGSRKLLLIHLNITHLKSEEEVLVQGF